MTKECQEELQRVVNRDNKVLNKYKNKIQKLEIENAYLKEQIEFLKQQLNE